MYDEYYVLFQEIEKFDDINDKTQQKEGVANGEDIMAVLITLMVLMVIAFGYYYH